MQPPSKWPTTRVGAYCLIVQDGAVLLARMAPDTIAPGRWTLPGGGVSFGESMESAARRETLEETGFHVVLREVMGVRVVDRDRHQSAKGDRFRAVQVVYRADITGGSLRHEVDESTDLAAWVPLSDMVTLPHVELVDWAVELLQSESLIQEV